MLMLCTAHGTYNIKAAGAGETRLYIYSYIYNFDFVSAAAADAAEMRECAGSSSFDRVCKCLIITVTSFGSCCCSYAAPCLDLY